MLDTFYKKNMQRISYAASIIFTALMTTNVHGAEINSSKTESVEEQKECVILLHGYARTAASFKIMEFSLERDGYQVINQTYPSRSASIEKLAAETLPDRLNQCATRQPHIVTHSLGGILVRAYLAQNPEIKVGHIIMLAPPNKGSELIDVYAEKPPFKWTFGPALKQLGTTANTTPNQIARVNRSIGIIAGNRSLNPLTSSHIEGPDDGKVSVESTKLPEMSDHITLPVSHTYMMNNPKVIGEVKAFLKSGKFNHSLTLRQALKKL